MVLAEKMHQRDPATAPAVGDRIPYVIIKGAKDAKAFEKAEDPLFVLENNLPLDAQYYLNNQLAKPLTRIFKPVLPNVSAVLFHGDHTRSIAMPVPKSGGIVGFAKRKVRAWGGERGRSDSRVQATCLNCKTALQKTESTVCAHCIDKEPLIYQKQLVIVRKLEAAYSSSWTQCQRCQGAGARVRKRRAHWSFRIAAPGDPVQRARGTPSAEGRVGALTPPSAVSALLLQVKWVLGGGGTMRSLCSAEPRSSAT